MRSALFPAFAFGLSAAHAQTGTTLVQPGAAPQISVQPVQTPVITSTQPTIIERPAAEPRLPELAPAEEKARAAKPAPEAKAGTNDFQELIRRSTGELPPLYGYDLFRAPSTFAPVENVPLTPDYLVGPGG